MNLPRDKRERLARFVHRAVREWAYVEDPDELEPKIDVYCSDNHTQLDVEVPRLDDLPYRFVVDIADL